MPKLETKICLKRMKEDFTEISTIANKEEGRYHV